MNKTELMSKWGKYINTDELVDKIVAKFQAYNTEYDRTGKNDGRHRCSENGVCMMLDEFFKNKEPLIKMFMSDPNYIGNLRIASMEDFDRQLDQNAIYEFCCSFPDRMRASEFLYKKTDDSGKTKMDYLVTGIQSFNVTTLSPESQLMIDARNRKEHLDLFDENGYTYESINKYDNFISDINGFEFRYYESALSREITYNNGEYTIPSGTKISRAFNQICKFYGIDKAWPTEETTTHNGETRTRTVYPYDKLFAKYSDLVSASTRKLWYIMSLNPLDYYTMSKGVSWVSCHNFEEGAWKQGSVSYMLDKVSIITFVVESIDENKLAANGITDISEEGKLYREMIHVKNHTIIQSRIYPQGNDGSQNLYTHFRDIITRKFVSLFNLDSNDWTIKTGDTREWAYITKHIGAHYPDLNTHNQCAIFYPQGEDAVNKMEIGHIGICPYCGREDENIRHSNFSHHDCLLPEAYI